MQGRPAVLVDGIHLYLVLVQQQLDNLAAAGIAGHMEGRLLVIAFLLADAIFAELGDAADERFLRGRARCIVNHDDGRAAEAPANANAMINLHLCFTTAAWASRARAAYTFAVSRFVVSLGVPSPCSSAKQSSSSQ